MDGANGGGGGGDNSGEPPYPYRDRADERARTFEGIRHHPLATYDTVAHVVKHMWDLETGPDGGSRQVGTDAWLELLAHLKEMLRQSIEYQPDPHDHSVRAEWLHERAGSGLDMQGASAGKGDGAA